MVPWEEIQSSGKTEQFVWCPEEGSAVLTVGEREKQQEQICPRARVRHVSETQNRITYVEADFAEGLRWTKDEGWFTFSITSFLLKSCFDYLGIYNSDLGSLKIFQNAVDANTVTIVLKKREEWDSY